MSEDSDVKRCQVEVLNGLGLHLRPAEKFVRAALRFQSKIIVTRGGLDSRGEVVDGKSILDLVMLAAERGTILGIEARGPDSEAAVNELVALVTAKFFEDDDGQSVEFEFLKS
jgi:phosphocarrier protein